MRAQAVKALVLAVFGASLGLTFGCEPDYVDLSIVGIETSTNADGSVHVSAVVTNGGSLHYRGQLCVQYTWLQGTQIVQDGSKESATGGATVDTQRPCRDVQLEPDEFLRLEADSTSSDPALVIEAKVNGVIDSSHLLEVPRYVSNP